MGISHGVNTLKIKQKVPTRTYIGIIHTKTLGIQFGKLSYLDGVKNTFISVEYAIQYTQGIRGIMPLIQEFLYEQHSYASGIEINFLAENVHGHGFSFSGVSATLLAYTLYMLVSDQDIDIFAGDATDPKSTCFSDIYRFSCRLVDAFSGGKSSGATNYTTLTKQGGPIIHFPRHSEEVNVSKSSEQANISGYE